MSSKLWGGVFAPTEKVHQKIPCKKAHLVDFGDTIHVKAEDVRRLPKVFCTQPKMALPCCLADLDVADEEKAQWTTFEFGGLFEWLCSVSSVSCCFLLAVPHQPRAFLS